MRDGGSHDDSPGAGVHGGLRVGGRVDAAFADDGLVGEFRRRLAHKRNIGPVGHAAIDGGAGMRERGRGDVASDGEGVADVLDRRAIGHDEPRLLP